jgi:hypothetical protein
MDISLEIILAPNAHKTASHAQLMERLASLVTLPLRERTGSSTVLAVLLLAPLDRPGLRRSSA